MEKDGKVLILKRIHVIYQLKIAPENQETAQRVHGFHEDFCPVARSIGGSVQISTALVFEPA